MTTDSLEARLEKFTTATRDDVTRMMWDEIYKLRTEVARLGSQLERAKKEAEAALRRDPPG